MPKKILVVDDHEDTRELLKIYIEDLGYDFLDHIKSQGYTVPLHYASADSNLNLKPGSTAAFIEDAAQRANYLVEEKGPARIILEKNKNRRSLRSGAGFEAAKDVGKYASV